MIRGADEQTVSKNLLGGITRAPGEMGRKGRKRKENAGLFIYIPSG